jgi:hypothetical protein
LFVVVIVRFQRLRLGVVTNVPKKFHRVALC